MLHRWQDGGVVDGGGKSRKLVNSVMKEAAGIAPPDWNTPASDFARMESSIANAKGRWASCFTGGGGGGAVD